jgi:CBS-domain-containing membrane protein
MYGTAFSERTKRVAILPKRAEEVMTANPLSLRDEATVGEAIAFLCAQGFSGAPVINAAGHPVGVVGRTELLRHATHDANERSLDEAGHDGASLMSDGLAGRPRSAPMERTTVREIMTPAIVAVPRGTSLAHVVEKMLARCVHRVFVIDKTGALVGVISSADVLRVLYE